MCHVEACNLFYSRNVNIFLNCFIDSTNDLINEGENLERDLLSDRYKPMKTSAEIVRGSRGYVSVYSCILIHVVGTCVCHINTSTFTIDKI